MIASFTRTAIPGFIFRLRTMPLRLLRKPITATRSAIGVTPASLPDSTWPPALWPEGCFLASFDPQAASASASEAARTCADRNVYSGVQAW